MFDVLLTDYCLHHNEVCVHWSGCARGVDIDLCCPGNKSCYRPHICKYTTVCKNQWFNMEYELLPTSYLYIYNSV